jgi:hypothetical protein
MALSSDRAPGADGDQRKRHGSPGKVVGEPAVRHDELDHGRHRQDAERGEARRQAEHEQDGEHDLAGRREKRGQMRHGESVGAAEDVQLELVLE